MNQAALFCDSCFGSTGVNFRFHEVSLQKLCLGSPIQPETMLEIILLTHSCDSLTRVR